MNRAKLLQIIREEIEADRVISAAPAGVSVAAGKAAAAFADSAYDAVAKAGSEVNARVSLIVQSAAKRVRDACVNAAIDEYRDTVLAATAAGKRRSKRT